MILGDNDFPEIGFPGKCFPEIDFLGKVKNYCIEKDWLLFIKTSQEKLIPGNKYFPEINFPGKMIPGN